MAGGGGAGRRQVVSPLILRRVGSSANDTQLVLLGRGRGVSGQDSLAPLQVSAANATGKGRFCGQTSDGGALPRLPGRAARIRGVRGHLQLGDFRFPSLDLAGVGRMQHTLSDVPWPVPTGILIMQRISGSRAA